MNRQVLIDTARTLIDGAGRLILGKRLQPGTSDSRGRAFRVGRQSHWTS